MSAQDLTTATQKRSLSALVERTGGLYSLPGVAMEVLELTKDPEVDAQKLKACIERDAALTAKILRVVNSSLFGLSREVSDLGQAVAILGAKPLKLLVLGFSLPDSLFADLAHDALANYWHGTLCKAVAARAIGDRYFNGRGDESLIVGLLQDIGLLVMLQELQRPFIDFVTKTNEAGVDLLTTERKTLGFDHTQLTRRMLDAWKLPESIVCAVEADPHDRDQFSSKAETLHEIVAAAGLLAKVLTDKRADTLQQLLQTPVFRKVDFEQIRALVVDLRDQVKQLADVLNVSCAGEFSYEQILMDAQAQMASCGEDVLVELVRTKEEALAAQYDEQELWSAFGGPRKQPRQQAETEVAQTANQTPAQETIPGGSRRMALTLNQELELALASAIALSRRERSATSLLLVSIDQDAELSAGKNLPDLFDRALHKAAVQGAYEALAVVSVTDHVGAIVVPHCERRAAVQDAGRILFVVRKSLAARFPATDAVGNLACGLASVALPHKHFQAVELFAAAARCLTAAQQAGSDAVKSIEIY